MKGKINKETRMITEVPTMVEPIEENYTYGARDRSGEVYDMTDPSFHSDMELYNKHLASLRSFPYIGFDNVEDGQEVSFEVEDQFWEGTAWWPTKHLVNGKVKPGTQTRTVAIPVPSNQESGDDDRMEIKIMEKTTQTVVSDIDKYDRFIIVDETGKPMAWGGDQLCYCTNSEWQDTHHPVRVYKKPYAKMLITKTIKFRTKRKLEVGSYYLIPVAKSIPE